MNGLLGYITFYFKIESDKQVAYAKINNDFRRLPNKKFVNSIKKSVREIYKEIGMDVISVAFCSEEEYETNKSKDIAIEHEWNDEFGIKQTKINKHN